MRLHPLERVVGGRLEYEGEGVAGALRAFRDAVATAGTDLSIQAQISVERGPQPSSWSSSPATRATGRRWPSSPTCARPTGSSTTSVRPQGFLDQQLVFNPGYGVDRNYWKGHFVRELPDELIDVLLARMSALGRPPGAILIESLHGAPKDVDPYTAALGYRDAAFNVSVMADWLDPALDDESIAWARETAAAIEPWSFGGGYANYMQADEPLERVRAAYGPASFDRLRALKRRYDPDNVLHRNQNIPPA